MNNKSVYQIVNTKKEYQDKINEILTKYFIKYMKKLYEEGDDYKKFQHELLKIPKISQDKVTKEYNKFIKHTNLKYDLSEEELTKILDIIFTLNIKIMTSLFDEIQFNPPKFQTFWIKCLKRVGKYYYENSKTSINNPDTTKVNESIDYVIQKYIPLRNIINSTHIQLEHYNFDNYSNYSNYTENTKNNANENIKVGSNSNQDNSLNYIKSEDFENEYYNSDHSISIDKKESEEVKQINIPRYHMKIHKKSFKKKSEIDEMFFDNI